MSESRKNPRLWCICSEISDISWKAVQGSHLSSQSRGQFLQFPLVLPQMVHLGVVMLTFESVPHQTGLCPALDELKKVQWLRERQSLLSGWPPAYALLTF